MLIGAQKSLRLLLVIISVLTLLGSSAKALSTYDILSTPFYDPTLSTSCNINLDFSLAGNSNQEKAFAFFVSKGLTAEQTAGVVGNFMWESSLDPQKVNGGSESITPPGNKAWGIAQWLGSRQTALVDYATRLGASPSDLATQLGFAWNEFNNTQKSAGDDLRTQTTVAGASDSVFKLYERAGDSTGPSRQKQSQAIYDTFASTTSTTTAATVPVTNGCSSVSGPGQNTAYVNGFTVYNQFDPTWANISYGTSTIGVAGCGPSAMAMIISNLTGQQVTPAITAAYADSQNQYVPGVGSKWSIAPVLAQNWGLKSTPIRANVRDITTALQAGQLVIASGQGPEPFTTGGHYIVIRAATANNMWRIGDSGHNNTSDKDWDPQELVSSMNNGSVYAISK